MLRIQIRVAENLSFVYACVHHSIGVHGFGQGRLVYMNFAFSEEQEELRKTVRAFLESKSPETAVREQMETENGFDPAVWSQMGEQMGLQGLSIPEEFGGSGFSFIELGVVLEEMGRALLCAPFFSSVVLAANALLLSGDDAAKKKYLPGIAAGETIATLATTEPSGKWDEKGITTKAEGSGSDWKITGSKMFVIDGATASLIIVGARTSKGVSLFAVDGDAKGLTRTSLSTMDQTRKQAKLEFNATPATLIGTDGKGWDVLSQVFDLAAVALAAEQVGGAQKVLEMAVEYAKVRVQFGRPIGSFQAIKHKCADMLLEVESAKSAAYYGMWCAAEMNEELASVASLAKAYCSEAYFHAAAENIQIHGGIGFTWEHPAHLYFKRAKSSELLFGDPTYHRELLAQRIGI
jgi:alkylation response protein AidB-like acyl-CoA dehydrogenase